MSRSAALKLVMEPLEEPPGDPEKTREHVSGLKKGEKVCRTDGVHQWIKDRDQVHGKNANRPGTIVTRIQKCRFCQNHRERDFLVVAVGKKGRGLRKLDDKWRMVYEDGYLLPKGSQRITEELREEMRAELFFADSKGFVYVDDKGDD